MFKSAFLLLLAAAPAATPHQQLTDQRRAFEARREGRILPLKEIERRVIPGMAGQGATRLLVEADDSPQLPRIAGDVVVYAADDAMYAADLRSWSSAKVTPTYGGVYADGGPVVTVGFAPAAKDQGSVQTLLDTAAAGPLGRAGC